MPPLKLEGKMKFIKRFAPSINLNPDQAFRYFIVLAALTFTLSLTLSVVSSVYAQADNPQPPTDDDVNTVAKQLYCPVCENTPLDVCPTQACEEWRQLIHDKLALGWNEEQVKIYFVDQYGDRVLAEPPARGLNWLVYIIPPLVFLVGLFVLYRVLRAWKKPPGKDQTNLPGNTENDEYIQRLEEDLKNL
jgi:cytochrome c-type biogenesis protein CcmH